MYYVASGESYGKAVSYAIQELAAAFVEGLEGKYSGVGHRRRLRGESKYGVHNRLWIGITDLFGVLWLKRRAKNLICEEVS